MVDPAARFYRDRVIRPIGPTAHGAIDYAFLVTQLAVPRLLGLSPRARLVFGAFGVLQGTLNAITDQPLAVRRVVPFQRHGQIEKAGGPVYALLPVLAGAVTDKRDRAYWLAMGAVLVTNFNLTDYRALPQR